MKKLKTIFLLTLILFLGISASSQTKPKADLINDKTLKAEIQPLDGLSPFRLSDYKGKIVVLVVWASWCAPCRSAMTELRNFDKDFYSHGVETIAVTFEEQNEENRATIKEVLQESEINFRVGLVDTEIGTNLLHERDKVPQVLVIASDGTIIKRFVGWNIEKTVAQIRETVEEIFTKPPVKQ